MCRFKRLLMHAPPLYTLAAVHWHRCYRTVKKMPTSTVKPVFTECTPSPMLNTRHNQRPVLGSDCPWEWAAQLSAQEKIKRLWKAPWRLVPAMCCRSYRKRWPLWLDGQWSVGCVWTEDMPVLVPLCQQWVHANLPKARTMCARWRICFKIPPPFKPRAANDLDLNISYLLAHPTPSLPDWTF